MITYTTTQIAAITPVAGAFFMLSLSISPSRFHRSKAACNHTKHPRTVCRGCPAIGSWLSLVNLDGFDDHILYRAVHPASFNGGDLVDDFARRLVGDFPEDGVAVVQPRRCVNSDEKL